MLNIVALTVRDRHLCPPRPPCPHVENSDLAPGPFPASETVRAEGWLWGPNWVSELMAVWSAVFSENPDNPRRQGLRSCAVGVLRDSPLSLRSLLPEEKEVPNGLAPYFQSAYQKYKLYVKYFSFLKTLQTVHSKQVLQEQADLCGQHCLLQGWWQWLLLGVLSEDKSAHWKVLFREHLWASAGTWAFVPEVQNSCTSVAE